MPAPGASVPVPTPASSHRDTAGPEDALEKAFKGVTDIKQARAIAVK